MTRWGGTFPWGRGRHECRCLTHSGATHTTSLVADSQTAGPASGRGVAEGGRGRRGGAEGRGGAWTRKLVAGGRWRGLAVRVVSGQRMVSELRPRAQSSGLPVA